MSSVLTPTNPVRFCIYRLRQSIAETSRFADSDLVSFINDGYLSACERTACLLAITTITIPAGTTEVALPADWSRTLRVYVAGESLTPVPYQDALNGVAGGVYQYGTTLGFTGDPNTTDVQAWLFYAQVPTILGLDDTPQWGPEWNYLLRHYAAWRCMLTASGAEDLGMMVNERNLYDIGVDHLRSATNRSLKSAPRLVETVLGAG
jgi:hypothetical protein